MTEKEGYLILDKNSQFHFAVEEDDMKERFKDVKIMPEIESRIRRLELEWVIMDWELQRKGKKSEKAMVRGGGNE